MFVSIVTEIIIYLLPANAYLSNQITSSCLTFTGKQANCVISLFFLIYTISLSTFQKAHASLYNNVYYNKSTGNGVDKLQAGYSIRRVSRSFTEFL